MRLICALVLLAFALPAQASGIAFEKQTTPGGLVYWYHARPDLPKTTLVAGWRDGVGFTTPGKEGLSEIGVRMLLRSASNHALDNVVEAMNDIGATGDMLTDGWSTYAILTGSPRNLAAAAGLAGRVLTSPLPEQKDLDRIAAQLADEVAAQEKDSQLQAEWAAMRFAAPGFPWTRLRDNPKLYRNISREDVEAWRRRVLARDNAVVAVEGPSPPEEIGPLLDRLTQTVAAKSDAPPRAPLVVLSRPRTVVIESETSQTVFFKAAPTNINADRARLKDSVAVAVLGGGFESRLMKTVRQKSGEAYDVRSLLYASADHSPLLLLGAVANNRAAESLASVDREYALWREQGVSAAELAAVASRFKAADDSSLREQGAAPRFFVTTARNGAPPNALFDYADLLASYTADDVNAEIKRRFPPGPLLTVIVAPSAAPFHADCVVKSWREVDGCK